VKEVMVKLEIMPYDEETGEGELRYIQAVITTQHNTAIPVGERYPKAKVQLSLVWNSRDEKAPAAELLPEFAEVRNHPIFVSNNLFNPSFFLRLFPRLRTSFLRTEATPMDRVQIVPKSVLRLSSLALVSCLISLVW
jgi:hypothetical protein